MTPVFVLPAGHDDTEYAIIVFPPELSFMEDAMELPIATAVLTLDLGKLLLGAAALS